MIELSKSLLNEAEDVIGDVLGGNDTIQDSTKTNTGVIVKDVLGDILPHA